MAHSPMVSDEPKQISEALTIELTNYCPHADRCSFCSTDSTADFDSAWFMSHQTVAKLITETTAQVIILSGGEPRSHKDYYWIKQSAKRKVGSRNVCVKSCDDEWIEFNGHVIPGIKTVMCLTPEESTDEIAVLKRIPQGREGKQPVVRFSRNWSGACPPEGCRHQVARIQNGKLVIAPAPCKKDQANPPATS